LPRPRLGARGFNQALLLARALGRRRGLPVAPRLLVRTRATEAQARLPAAERRRNLDGAFTVRTQRLRLTRPIVLVDDVLTTGATADACARALLAAGAGRVDVYTVGRAPCRARSPCALRRDPRALAPEMRPEVAERGEAHQREGREQRPHGGVPRPPGHEGGNVEEVRDQEVEQARDEAAREEEPHVPAERAQKPREDEPAV